MEEIKKLKKEGLPEDEEKKALIDIASILMMYACGKYGMNKIY